MVKLLTPAVFEAKLRAELVTAILERQDLLASGEHAERASFFVSAQAIAQGSGQSTKKVEDRVKQLQTGTPDDQTVYEILRPPPVAPEADDEEPKS